jgi:hypothetical protein
MRTGEVDWSFPVLGFTPDGDIWGFPDFEALTICGPRTLKDHMQADMELVDADGRQWRVLSLRRTGSGSSLLRRLMFFAPQLSRIDHELQALPTATLAETLERVSTCMETNPTDWCDDDDQGTELRARQAEVRALTSIRGVHDVLGLDWFEGY